LQKSHTFISNSRVTTSKLWIIHAWQALFIIYWASRMWVYVWSIGRHPIISNLSRIEQTTHNWLNICFDMTIQCVTIVYISRWIIIIIIIIHMLTFKIQQLKYIMHSKIYALKFSLWTYDKKRSTKYYWIKPIFYNLCWYTKKRNRI
jgi:hypothetical protein